MQKSWLIRSTTDPNQYATRNLPRTRQPLQAVARLLFLLLACGGQADRHLGHTAVLSALARNHIPLPGRTVVEAKDVCSPVIEGDWYKVIDLVEQIGDGLEPHDYRRALVLRPYLTQANEVPYFSPARPVACHGNVLNFSKPVEIDNTLPEGTKVRFSNGAADVEVISGY